MKVYEIVAIFCGMFGVSSFARGIISLFLSIAFGPLHQTKN